MAIKEAIAKVISGHNLEMSEAAEAMEEVVAGLATPAQISALAVGLRMKGETPAEIAGFATVMRREAVKVDVSGSLVDTCGTGGDGSSTFNISTVAAFVASGAGARVAKHGNRAYTSSCGSADVLEALGIAIDLQPDDVSTCVEQVGIGFMFAPMFHPAMKHAAGPRKEIGIRTIFNVLGPLTNPAGASAQVMGVASASLAPVMGEVLGMLGCRRGLVVHGSDGLDEITVAGETQVVEVTESSISEFVLRPEELGLHRSDRSSLVGGDSERNAEIAEAILAGERGARRDIVMLNAAAALYASGEVASIRDGLQAAAISIDSGAAAAKLQSLREVSRSLKERRLASVS